MPVTLSKQITDGGLWAALDDHASSLGHWHGSHLGNPFLSKASVVREVLAYGADMHPPVLDLHPRDASKIVQSYEMAYVWSRDNLTGNRTDAAVGAPVVTEWSTDRQAWHDLDS